MMSFGGQHIHYKELGRVAEVEWILQRIQNRRRSGKNYIQATLPYVLNKIAYDNKACFPSVGSQDNVKKYLKKSAAGMEVTPEAP